MANGAAPRQITYYNIFVVFRIWNWMLMEPVASYMLRLHPSSCREFHITNSIWCIEKKKIFVLRTTFLYGSLTYFIWHQVKTKVIIFVLFNFLRHGNDDRWLHGWWIATILLWLMNLARQSSPAHREHDRRIFCDSHPHTAFIWTGTETIKKIFASLRMDYNLATHSSRNDFFNIQSDERRNKCNGTSCWLFQCI